MSILSSTHTGIHADLTLQTVASFGFNIDAAISHGIDKYDKHGILLYHVHNGSKLQNGFYTCISSKWYLISTTNELKLLLQYYETDDKEEYDKIKMRLKEINL